MSNSGGERPMEAIRIEKRPDGVAMVVLDHPTKPVNTLSVGLVEEVGQKMTGLLQDPAVKAVVLVSAKKDTFIAGADLDILQQATTAEEVSRLSREGNALLSAIAASPKPVVAAVHGAALGGGLEVALACSYILASDDPLTVLGQAEVMLGLLPAGGGTQRLIKRTGLIAGLPLLLTGQRVRAKKAYRLGLVDALTTPGGIAETGARAALALADGSLKQRTRKKRLMEKLTALPPMRDQVLKKARQAVMAKTRGNYPAPPAILDCAETGLKKGMAAGLALESHYFGELAMSQASRSLVWLFHATTGLKKQKVAERPIKVNRLGIVGGGFMGAGIASVSLGLCPVTVRDLDPRALAGCAKEVEGWLAKLLRSEAIRPLERDRRRSNLQLSTEAGTLAGCELIIEAVFEKLDLKQKVLAQCEELADERTVFASNTSALPIGDIAAQAKHPERVVGMHYFSPVPKMPLLEIVVPDGCAPWAVATALKFGQKQGKAVILVKDRPGFYTSRILGALLSEAMSLVQQGARIEDLDRASKDFGFPVGPMALLDEVGLEVVAHVSRDLAKAFAAYGVTANPGLLAMTDQGYQGRKNNKGFYVYPPPRSKAKKKPNEAVYAFFGGGERRDIDREQLGRRLGLAMVNESGRCLDEGVIDSPLTGDVGAVLGLGFPPFTGGPFHYLDAQGAGRVLGWLQELATTQGQRFTPAQSIAEAAATGSKFFPST
ncbi:MAG: enoyl-CoA hydratase/isomerase family protein [Proteobacteria bacterium]|nr:enoyl-CoA hydratase/isomerase family protein [Pseudomonadota bacterium]MBU4576689.1 enoyl-CoA hydratase/isomerase family protein [Pseudomonadota bacterium]MBU4597194.1 enoyl-CoA hydratase/isomerase family protein [Pseudomonadota bacterium]